MQQSKKKGKTDLCNQGKKQIYPTKAKKRQNYIS